MTDARDVRPARGGLLYFDCFAGIAGDMALAALVDLGVPRDVVERAVGALALPGCRVIFERVRRGALCGLKLRVDEGAHDPIGHGHRSYASIRSLLRGAAISDGVRVRALDLFERLGRVEAALHGVPLDEVAFHEVGAVDSLVDVVGLAAALDWLAPSEVVCRRVPLGHGVVETAHGRLPVPAPATLALLEGAPVEDGGIEGELTTPTGAALLAAVVHRYGLLPPCTIDAIGWGAGERELADRPNLLRVVLGRPDPAVTLGSSSAFVIEANVDDLAPSLAAPIIDQLLAAGARDAWLQPVVMKKGRPALVIGALVEAGAREAVETVFFRESSTIGLRAHPVERTLLERRVVEVATPYGPVAVKVAGPEDAPLNVAPELEVCRALAERAGVPLKRVHAEALAAYYRRVL